MGKTLLQVTGTNLDSDSEIASLLSGRYSNQFAIFLCDTEADLPTPAWGRFAVVMESNQSGHYYFQVGTSDGWKRTKLNQ